MKASIVDILRRLPANTTFEEIATFFPSNITMQELQYAFHALRIGREPWLRQLIFNLRSEVLPSLYNRGRGAESVMPIIESSCATMVKVVTSPQFAAAQTAGLVFLAGVSFVGRRMYSYRTPQIRLDHAGKRMDRIQMHIDNAKKWRDNTPQSSTSSLARRYTGNDETTSSIRSNVKKLESLFSKLEDLRIDALEVQVASNNEKSARTLYWPFMQYNAALTTLENEIDNLEKQAIESSSQHGSNRKRHKASVQDGIETASASAVASITSLTRLPPRHHGGTHTA